MKGFLAFVKEHSKLIIGILSGLTVGILMLTVGFFPTLLLGICVGIGALIGSDGEAKRAMVRFLDKILPNIFK